LGFIWFLRVCAEIMIWWNIEAINLACKTNWNRLWKNSAKWNWKWSRLL